MERPIVRDGMRPAIEAGLTLHIEAKMHIVRQLLK